MSTTTTRAISVRATALAHRGAHTAGILFARTAPAAAAAAGALVALARAAARGLWSLAGPVLIVTGIWQWSHPSALIAAGALLLADRISDRLAERATRREHQQT